ncbi:hypothetical protein D9M72_447530 [compost metagenome]
MRETSCKLREKRPQFPVGVELIDGGDQARLDMGLEAASDADQVFPTIQDHLGFKKEPFPRRCK